MKKLKAAFLFAGTVALSAVALGQNENTKLNAEYFRFDFSLKETEGGKVVNTRNYQTMARTDEAGMSSIRSNGKVPIPTNEKAFTYIDVGVSIDVRHVNHVKDELSVDIIADISGVIEPPNPQTPQTGPPVIRQTRWNSIVLIPIRKPVVIFSSDDAGSKRQLQLEITATPVH
jgi:hypothetical protein